MSRKQVDDDARVVRVETAIGRESAETDEK